MPRGKPIGTRMNQPKKNENLKAEVLITEGNYSLMLIKGLDKKGQPFSLFLPLLEENATSVQHALENGEPLDLTLYQSNFIYLKNSHDVTQEEREDALKYFRRQFLGRERNYNI